MAEAGDLVINVKFEPPIEEVARLALKPGDTLVVKINEQFHGPLAAEQTDVMRRRLEAIFPGHKVLIVWAGIDLEVVESTQAASDG